MALIEKHQKAREDALYALAASKIERQQGLYGLLAIVARINQNGNGHLMVEKDLEVPGYLQTTTGQLSLVPFTTPPSMPVSNLVAHIIEKGATQQKRPSKHPFSQPPKTL